MCSKLVRYFLRGRNNKATDSVQFLDYNPMTRLRFLSSACSQGFVINFL